MSKRLTYEEFSKRFNEVQKSDLELLSEKDSGYIDASHKVKVRCPEHGIIEGPANSFLLGYTCCSKCRIRRRKLAEKKSFEEFTKEFKKIFNNKLELLPIEYAKFTDSGHKLLSVKIKCPKRGVVWKRVPVRDVLEFNGCYCCKKCNYPELYSSN